MTKQAGFTIEVSSRYDGFWRYNTALVCGCFDAADKRTGFVSASSHVADVGAGLSARPADCPADRKAALATPPCDHIVCYLYLIPHTLPSVDEIDAVRPFEIDVRIAFGGRKVRTERFRINQWSGASIELRARAE